MFYLVKLNRCANQGEILQKLKNAGCEAIQTADGLCVRSEKSAADLQKLLGVEIVPLNTSGELAPDIEAFVYRQ